MKKRYAAWARIAGSNNQFVTTVIYANNIAEAKGQLAGYELQGKVYRSKVK